MFYSNIVSQSDSIILRRRNERQVIIRNMYIVHIHEMRINTILS